MATIKVIGKVKTDRYGTVAVLVGRYPAGNAVFVNMVNRRGEPIATFSVNLVPYGAEIADDEFTVKTWGGNEQFVAPMLAAGWFEDTGRRVPTGYVEAQVWRIKDAKLVPERHDEGNRASRAAMLH